MKLERLKLKNFRKFKVLDIEFNDGLNVFVGENNSGKTAILDAIKLVLDTNSTEYNNLNDSDFYQEKKETENELNIKLIFKIKDKNDGGNFLEYLTYEEENKAKLYITLTAERKTINKKGFIVKNIKTGKDNNGKELESELKELLYITYLKPLRDAENELIAGRNSRLSKILEGYFNFKEKDFADNPKLKKLIKGVSFINQILKKRINELKKEEKCEKGFKEDIKENYLDKITLDNQYDILLSLADSKEDKQIFKNLLNKLDLKYDSNGKQGLGYQNLLFMATEMLLLENEKNSPSKIIVIEEPEAHLHPQHQIKFLKFIKDKEDLQTFITTHSPNLASQVPIENIFYCKDDEVYSLRKKETNLKDDKDGDIRFLEKFLDVTKSDLFFAKGLIFVEGISEQLVLPEIAGIMDFPLEENGISIINLGNTSFERFAKIFQNSKGYERIEIPIAFIRDLDYEYDEIIEITEATTKAIEEKRTKLKKNLESKNPNFYEVFISKNRTFEYDWFYKNKHLLLEAIKNTYKERYNLTNTSLIGEVYHTINNRDKSEVAYELAKILENKKGEIKNNINDYIPLYLTNAIDHIKEKIKNNDQQQNDGKQSN